MRLLFFFQIFVFIFPSDEDPVSALMIIIAFTPYKIKIFKNDEYFYLISFMFGGAAFMIFYFMESRIYQQWDIYIGDFSIKILLFWNHCLCINHFVGIISRQGFQEKNLYSNIDRREKNKSEMNALVDTGNFLQDPLSKYR